MHVKGPNIIKEASGIFVRDEQGRQLLDGLAGLWCVNVGYGRTEIIEAIERQLRTLCYYPSFFNSTTSRRSCLRRSCTRWACRA
jgi:putrescine aminotransferase